MVYNPATDFLGLWRNNAGVVSKEEMPGLDFVVAALARAGAINLTVAAAAPVANQSTTAWLKAATPSYSAEGQLNLWDKITTAYLPATPTLFLQLLEACAGENGVSWWYGAGAPGNLIGNNGDFYIRSDAPNGTYGPKALGAWPLTPIPGTADAISSLSLDNTFGNTPGRILYRGVSLWQPLNIGAEDTVLTSLGGFPAWDGLSALFDVLFSNARGAILYRSGGAWTALPPGGAGQVLSANGVGADVTWSPRTAEFPSGTVMLFRQSAAPPGWTKLTTANDVGIRVTSGAVGSVAGAAFSTVFAQTVVGDTTLSASQMPSHTHSSNANLQNSSSSTGGGGFSIPSNGAATINANGASASHNHSINLAMGYVDVIIASKN